MLPVNYIFSMHIDMVIGILKSLHFPALLACTVPKRKGMREYTYPGSKSD